MADPSAPPVWKRPRTRRYALAAALWLIILAVALMARGVLLPFLLAVIFAFALEPAVARLTQIQVRGRNVPRAAAVVFVYLVLGLVLWFAAVSLLPRVYQEAVKGLSQVKEFLAGLTHERIEAWAKALNDWLASYDIPIDVGDSGREGVVTLDLVNTLADALDQVSGSLRAHVGDVVTFSRALVGGAFATVFFLLLLFMITAFLSVDAPQLVFYTQTLVPAEWRPGMKRLLAGMESGLAGVVRGQLTICMVNGALTLAGLLILKIPFAFALAALATVLYLIPIFGTILSSVPIVFLGLVGGGARLALFALAWILAIHALEAYFLSPKIMGHHSRLHPLVVLLAVLVGEHTFGLVGALLAAPVASVVGAVFKFLRRRALELESEGVGAQVVPPP